MKKIGLWVLCLILLAGCRTERPSLDVEQQLDYCLQQAKGTLQSLTDSRHFPRSIKTGEKQWRLVDYRDWTSGFWPGILWQAAEVRQEQRWQAAADSFTQSLFPLVDSSVIDHDIGFQLFCSAGNGYRLTGNATYRQVLLRAADSLATLFNPRVGTILSWPREVPGVDWPLRHNTIMDNMLNLELLFWAAKNGGSQRLYEMAVSHASKTMANQFRPDYTSYHVVVYDTATGERVKAITHQGLADSSMWARGQAWAIYGYTMVYRETKDPVFLDFAQKVTDVYLERLPADGVPYWDFDDPAIPEAPKDASAAAIVASALLELSAFTKDKTKAAEYYRQAVNMLTSLSGEAYQSRKHNSAFLLHSTGHKPGSSEIDASINYADYYYLEALLRLRKLQAAAG